jgi:hypothetical protein
VIRAVALPRHLELAYIPAAALCNPVVHKAVHYVVDVTLIRYYRRRLGRFGDGLASPVDVWLYQRHVEHRMQLGQLAWERQFDRRRPMELGDGVRADVTWQELMSPIL